ncbi:MAG: AAA family ATPase [Halothiobacillaceae bacterium]
MGHLLLALKQTARLADRKRALHLGDLQSDIDLGTFEDCLYQHDLKAKFGFTLGWRLPERLTITDPLNKKAAFPADHLRLSATLRADARGLPMVEQFSYALLHENQTTLNVRHELDARGKAKLDVDPMHLIRAPGRKWDVEPPEKFYRFSDVTLARYQNADALAVLPLELERLLDGLVYLGPLREPPHRTYHWAGDTVPNVGARGEYAIAAILAAADAGRKLNRGYKQRLQRFDTFIAAWLKDLGVIHSFNVRPIAKGRKEYEVVVRSSANGSDVKLTDVGFGVSQVLPALVQAFYAPPHSTVWMEQPEIHLHPKVQAELADAFISAVQAYENSKPRSVQLVIESHSEHFLLRLQRRVAEGLLKPEDVAVYFVRDGNTGAQLEELKLNLFGEIENWPEDFFGDDLGEIAARTKAAMQRQMNDGGALHG